MRCVQMLPVVKDFLAPNGEWVLDFGQNITGVVRAKLDLPAGAQVRLRHAESLDENGNFYTGNLSLAKSEDTFRSAGQPAEYLPRFTYHGFRYLCVEGLPESQRDPVAFTACVLTTDLRRTGQFRCSDERVNQQHSGPERLILSNDHKEVFLCRILTGFLPFRCWRPTRISRCGCPQIP